MPPLRDGDKRLYLVRHGETDWNLQDRIQGRTDNPLNPTGRKQAEAVSSFLANEPLELITSSSLMRAGETADAIACLHPAAVRLAGLPEFQEMCFGDIEGQTLTEIRATYKATVAAWRSGDNARKWPGQGGESPNDVAERGLDGLRRIGMLPSSAANAIEATARTERHILVAAHGRFNKILLAALRGDVSMASDLQQGNTAINVIDFAPDGSSEVRLLNCQEHLKGSTSKSLS